MSLRGGPDHAEHLLPIQPGHLGERHSRLLRVAEPAGADLGYPGQGRVDERGALGVQHGGARRHRGDYGHPHPLAQAGVDDRGAPHHPPAGGRLAHREASLVTPGRAVLAEVHGREEVCLGGAAVLGDRAHGQVVGGRPELLVGGTQVGSHGGRAAGGQRRRGLVLPLGPGQQEVLCGWLSGRLAAGESARDPDDQQEDHHTGGAQLQLPRPQAQAAHPSPDAAAVRYAPADGRLRNALFPNEGRGVPASSRVRPTSTVGGHGLLRHHPRRRKARSTSRAASRSAKS